jgi:hypothetical protein
MSLFQGTKLRTNYKETLSSALVSVTATSQSSALLIANLDKGARYMFIDNRTDAEITLYLVNTEDRAEGSLPTVADRQLWLRISASQVLNLDFLPSIQMFFQPGTLMYASYEGSAPSTGKIKMSWWA